MIAHIYESVPGEVLVPAPDPYLEDCCVRLAKLTTAEAAGPSQWLRICAEVIASATGASAIALDASWRNDSRKLSTLFVGRSASLRGPRASNDPGNFGTQSIDDDSPAACVPWAGPGARTGLLEAVGVDTRLAWAEPLDPGRQDRWFVVESASPSGIEPSREVSGAFRALAHGSAAIYNARFARLDAFRRSLVEKLPPAVRPSAPLLARGDPESDVARAIHRSVHTVHDHLKQLYRELNVHNRIQLRNLWDGRGADE